MDELLMDWFGIGRFSFFQINQMGQVHRLSTERIIWSCPTNPISNETNPTNEMILIEIPAEARITLNHPDPKQKQKESASRNASWGKARLIDAYFWFSFLETGDGFAVGRQHSLVGFGHRWRLKRIDAIHSTALIPLQDVATFIAPFNHWIFLQFFFFFFFFFFFSFFLFLPSFLPSIFF